MKTRNLYLLLLSAILVIGMAASGCSGKSELLTQVSGQWQDSQNKSTVEINLAGNAQSLKVNGKSYPVTVDKIEKINYMVFLKVQNGGPEPELWTLRQVWDESGSSFKLAFNHGGEKETLVPKGES